MDAIFSFEVGKKYIRRDGKIAVCTNVFDDGGAEFDRELNDCSNYCVWSSGRMNASEETKFDIIKPYIEPNRLKLIDITKHVQTRDGRPVTQLIKFETNSRMCIYGVVEGVVYCWMNNGNHYDNSNLDLFNVPDKKIVPLEFGDILPGDLISITTKSISSVVCVKNDFVCVAEEGKFTFEELMAKSQW